MTTTTEELHARARATAKGWRQAALVDELLTNVDVPNVEVLVPGRYAGGAHAVKVGQAHVDWRSWLNLRKRLQAAGFRVERSAWRRKPLWPPVERKPAYPLPVIPGTRYFEASWLPYPSRTHYKWDQAAEAVSPVLEHYHVTSHGVYLSPAFASALRGEL